jgi:DNA-binding transcriptional ArsR family regulator
VSRHLKVLERAALISRSRSGKWRASHLEAAPLREAADWIEGYRRFWDSSLARLDAHLVHQAECDADERPAWCS